jgi:hypothetical protein
MDLVMLIQVVQVAERLLVLWQGLEQQIKVLLEPLEPLMVAAEVAVLVLLE